jgi:hypothetical protein
MKKLALIVVVFTGCASQKPAVHVVQQMPYPQASYQQPAYPRMTTSFETKAIIDPYSTDKPLDHIEIVFGARKNW